MPLPLPLLLAVLLLLPRFQLLSNAQPKEDPWSELPTRTCGPYVEADRMVLAPDDKDVAVSGGVSSPWYFYTVARCAYTSRYAPLLGRSINVYNDDETTAEPGKHCGPQRWPLPNAVCDFAIRPFDCCSLTVYRCPACPRGTYLSECKGGGLGAPTVRCAPCRNSIPPNSVYGYMTPPLAECAHTPCLLGSSSSNEEGASSCVPCPAVPANANRAPNDDDGGGARAFCNWYCNVGYRETETRDGCVACPTRPLNAAWRGYTGAGDTGCLWTCLTNDEGAFNNNYYYYDPAGDQCRQIIGCTPPDWSAVPTCTVGAYRNLDSSCRPIMNSCQACSNAQPRVSYYVLDVRSSISRSASASGVCFTAACTPSTTPGTQRVQCGGTSEGNPSAPCESVPLWNDRTRAFATRDARYYVLDPDGYSRCSTEACTVCPPPNTFNTQCPAIGVRSFSEGACASCAAMPDNAQWPAAEPWPYAIARADECPFRCNAGYYYHYENAATTTTTTTTTVLMRRTRSACARCASSADCKLAGQYKLGCNDPDCHECPGSSGPTAGSFFWRGSAADAYGPSACRWFCKANWYADVGEGTCVECLVPACPDVGFYAQAACLDAPDVRVAPSCERCITPQYARAVGPGAVTNVPTSCPFECATGYRYDGSARCCVLWTPAPSAGSSAVCANGDLWWPGDAWNDGACRRCPRAPAVGDTANVLWTGCQWSCSTGYTADALLARCVACPAGTAMTSAAAGNPCTPCSQASYQASPGSTACDALPTHSVRNQGGDGFVCEPAYYYLPGTILLSSSGSVEDDRCAPCAPGYSTVDTLLVPLHMRFAVFAADACRIVAFACRLGYYREALPPTGISSIGLVSGGRCTPCPVVVFATPLAPDAEAGIAAAVELKFGVFPTTTTTIDDDGERNQACPPTATKCNDGYYYYATPFPRGGGCNPCATGCPTLGEKITPCRGNRPRDTCSACPGLAIGQMWVTVGVCDTRCIAGYFAAPITALQEATCASCPPGTYQPSAPFEGDRCTDCAAGTYAGAAGASVCTSCPRGTFNDGVDTAAARIACLDCPAGTYSTQRGQTRCIDCTEGTFSAEPGALRCQRCPPETPRQALPGRAGCLPPVGPACPPGFFLLFAGSASSSASSVCQACPEGTFCPGGERPYPLPCPPKTAPAPRMALAMGQCEGAKAASIDPLLPLTEPPYAEYPGGPSLCVFKLPACAAGQYSTLFGTNHLASCRLCAAGTFTTTPMASACTECAPGRYAPLAGATACLACAGLMPGAWTVSAGATVCDSVAPGYYDAAAASAGLHRRFTHAGVDLPRGRWWDASDQEQHAALPQGSAATLSLSLDCQQPEGLGPCALSGGASDWLDFGQGALPPVPWTVCAIVRSTGAAATGRGLAPVDSDALVFGHYGGAMGVLRPSTLAVTALPGLSRFDWLVLCAATANTSSGSGGTTPTTTAFYNGAQPLPSSNLPPRAVAAAQFAGLRLGINRRVGTEPTAAFAVAELVVWQRALPASALRALAGHFSAYLPTPTTPSPGLQAFSAVHGLLIPCAPDDDDGLVVVAAGAPPPCAPPLGVRRCLPDGSPLCCPPGTFFVEGRSLRCEPCPPGTFATTGGATACTIVVDAADETPPQGAVRATGSATLRPACPPGTTTLQGGASSRYYCYAAPGYYGLPGHEAAPCPLDAYCPMALLNPLPCPSATPYTNALGARAPDQCSSVMRPPCRPGHYLPFSGAVCQTCPAASVCPGAPMAPMATCPPESTGPWYSPEGATRVEQCGKPPPDGIPLLPPGGGCPLRTHAPPGTAPLTSSLQCRADAGAYFVPGVMPAGVVCPEGHHCAAGAPQPLPCATDEACTLAGFTTTPQRCPGAGSVAPLGACTPCDERLPEQAYYPLAGDCRMCCPPGLVKTQQLGPAGTTTTTTVCAPFPDSTTCASPGQYRPDPPSSSSPPECAATVPECAACPSSSSLSSFPERQGAVPAVGLPPATLGRLLRAFAPALPPGLGSTWGASSCAYTCPPGACYADLANFSEGRGVVAYHTSLAAVVVECVRAAAGAFADAALGRCAPCPRNTYASEAGAAACYPCPGTALAEPGSRQCRCTNGGVLLLLVVVGAVVEAGVQPQWDCVPCRPGTILDPLDPYRCIPCPDGTTPVPYPNSDPALAEVCLPGFQRASPIASCLPCPPGTVSEAAGATACTACPLGAYADAPRLRCLPCPNGTYGAQPGLASADECVNCTASTTPMMMMMRQVAGGGGCRCPAGFYYLDYYQGCAPCAARCPKNAVPVMPMMMMALPDAADPADSPPVPMLLRLSLSSGLAPACAHEGAVNADAVACACPPGFRGDGLRACTECANPSECVCVPGAYYSATTGGCLACRRCPPIAVLTLNACDFGSTADTVDCYCPAGYYYARRWNECFPCTRGAACAVGAKRDA